MSAIRPPLEAGMEALFERRNLAGRTICRDHELFLHVVEGVERVEKFFLRALLAGDELDIVHQQDIVVPVSFPERREAIISNSVDQLVGELFG